MNQVPWLDLHARPTVLLRLSLEPSARKRRLIIDAVAHARRSSSFELYVVCIVSFVGSQSSPFFQSRSTMAAIFRASVTLASSGFVPRATHAS